MGKKIGSKLNRNLDIGGTSRGKVQTDFDDATPTPSISLYWQSDGRSYDKWKTTRLKQLSGNKLTNIQ